jgi:hypothetical protein
MDKLQLGSTAALIRYGIEHRLHGEDAPGAWPDESAAGGPPSTSPGTLS